MQAKRHGPRHTDAHPCVAFTSLQHVGNRVRDHIQVACVECCNADTTRADGIDAELFAQTVHLRCRQARVREHAALCVHEAEVACDASRLQAFDEAIAHRADTIAHFAQFRFPRCAQFSEPSTAATTEPPCVGGFE